MSYMSGSIRGGHPVLGWVPPAVRGVLSRRGGPSVGGAEDWLSTAQPSSRLLPSYVWCWAAEQECRAIHSLYFPCCSITERASQQPVSTPIGLWKHTKYVLTCHHMAHTRPLPSHVLTDWAINHHSVNTVTCIQEDGHILGAWGGPWITHPLPWQSRHSGGTSWQYLALKGHEQKTGREGLLEVLEREQGGCCRLRGLRRLLQGGCCSSGPTKIREFLLFFSSELKVSSLYHYLAHSRGIESSKNLRGLKRVFFPYIKDKLFKQE